MGITDYQILDPAHHDLAKQFSYVLYVGELSQDRFKKLESMSQKAWILPAPLPTASDSEKKKWLSSIELIKDWMLDHRDRDRFKKTDVPDLMSLEQFLNSKVGQVMELTLPDRRKLGIYPDSQRLLGEFDIEYHASTVVNIAKLFKLFDASEIIIKEI